MSFSDIKKEASDAAATMRAVFASLDLSEVDLKALQVKYNAICSSVLGTNYQKTAELYALPAFEPNTLSDELRLALSKLVLFDDVTLPSNNSLNLSSLQSMYFNADSSLSTIEQQLSEHPLEDSRDAGFTSFMNMFVAKPFAERDATAIYKQIETENVSLFVFSELPGLTFAVYPKFLGKDTQLAALSRHHGVSEDSISVSVYWFHAINGSSSNLARLRSVIGLSSNKLRVAGFGDDLASSFTEPFRLALDRMDAIAQSAIAQSDKNISQSDLTAFWLNSLESLFKESREFLSGATFEVSLITDVSVLENLISTEISSKQITNLFDSRQDTLLSGVASQANFPSSPVFPTTSNASLLSALAEAHRQDPNTVKISTGLLNKPQDLKKALVEQAKRVLASVEARKLSIPRSGRVTAIGLWRNIQQDLAALREAYETFVSPPASESQIIGSRTTDSPAHVVERSVDIIKNLRLEAQIKGLSINLAPISETLLSLTKSLGAFFGPERRDLTKLFLTQLTSLTSFTNFLLSDGVSSNNLIVTKFPKESSKLRQAVNTQLLSDLTAVEIFQRISIQVEAFISAIRLESDENPVEKLIRIPLLLIDSAILTLELEEPDIAVLNQLRSSFEILSTCRDSLVRDLGVHADILNSAISDAQALVAELPVSFDFSMEELNVR